MTFCLLMLLLGRMCVCVCVHQCVFGGVCDVAALDGRALRDALGLGAPHAARHRTIRKRTVALPLPCSRAYSPSLGCTCRHMLRSYPTLVHRRPVIPWRRSNHTHVQLLPMSSEHLWKWLAAASAVASAVAAVGSWRAANATLRMAEEERRDRIERVDTEAFQKLEVELRNPKYVNVDRAMRLRFQALVKSDATLADNALRVYAEATQRAQSHPQRDEEANALLTEWYFVAVHRMVQLGFRNEGPVAAFGNQLEAASTFLYLIMWRIGSSVYASEAERRTDILALCDIYNRTAGMARRCKTEHIRVMAERELLSKEAATALFERLLK